MNGVGYAGYLQGADEEMHITVVLHGAPIPAGDAQGSLGPQKLPWIYLGICMLGRESKRIHMPQDQLHVGNFPQEATQVKAGCAEINMVKVPGSPMKVSDGITMKTIHDFRSIWLWEVN